MAEYQERRVADERHRIDVSQRLAALEVSQKLYHDELKSIIEGLHVQLGDVQEDLSTVKSTLYGGPNNKVGLLGKVTIATGILITAGTFLTKPFGEAFNHFVLKKLGDDPTTQLVQQSTKKRLQLFNRKTGEYEYFIEYQPVGAKKKKDDDE